MPAPGYTIAQLGATGPLILLCAALMAADGSVRRESLVFDSFESSKLEGWDMQAHSRMERVIDEKRRRPLRLTCSGRRVNLAPP